MIRLTHLETDITQACNMSCVGCNHEVPLWRKLKGGPWHAEPKQVESDLFHLSKVAHADVWGALGGEPLLSKHLVEILHIVRVSSVADRLEVWTNGTLLRRASSDFWQSFDILVLSIYPGKLSDDELDWIAKKCADSGVELSIRDERYNPNFRTLFEPVPTDEQATRAKFAGCFFRHFSRSVNYGYFFTCCCAPSMPMLIQGKSYGTDGIPVEGITEEMLRGYLEREEPLGCCSICAGRDTAVAIPWHEERNPQVWLRESGASA